MVKVGAINCETNIDVCRDQWVNSFPTMKLYPPRSSKPHHGLEVQPLEMTPPSLRSAVAHGLAKVATNRRYPRWPILDALNATSREELATELRLDRPTLIVIEDDDSTVGTEVQLRANCDSNCVRHCASVVMFSFVKH